MKGTLTVIYANGILGLLRVMARNDVFVPLLLSAHPRTSSGYFRGRMGSIITVLDGAFIGEIDGKYLGD